jgi:phosphoribosyl 1,2-cyclic phosphate phosphodiesterase
LETETTRLLVDCGPDFRQQILPFDFKPIDGVLLTHIHYDHVAGIDDIRPFCVFGPIQIYADASTVEGLKHTMPYCFSEHLYPGVPLLSLHEVALHEPIHIGDMEVVPFRVMHGKMPILGFRVGALAYITDMKTMAEEEMPFLQGVDTLVVNALRLKKEHHSHQLLADAVAFAQKTGARRTFLTHMTHQIGLHEVTNATLPDGIDLAYDGLVVEIE